MKPRRSSWSCSSSKSEPGSLEESGASARQRVRAPIASECCSKNSRLEIVAHRLPRWTMKTSGSERERSTSLALPRSATSERSARSGRTMEELWRRRRVCRPHQEKTRDVLQVALDRNPSRLNAKAVELRQVAHHFARWPLAHLRLKTADLWRRCPRLNYLPIENPSPAKGPRSRREYPRNPVQRYPTASQTLCLPTRTQIAARFA